MHIYHWLLVAALAGWCHGAAADEPSAALKDLKELAATPLAERADEWLCEFLVADTCASDGCDREELGPQVRWVLLDFAAEPDQQGRVAYSRCDLEGCDRRAARASHTGIYTLIELPQAGSFLKVLNDGSAFVDVTTLGTAAFINHGRCQAQ